MNASTLSIKDMKACRDERLVLDIDELNIAAGEHVAVSGPNGAGKSTLLQIINALLPYESGEVRLFGEKISAENYRALRLRSSLVFQEALLLSSTVYENVSLPLKFRKVPPEQIKPLAEKAMAAFHCRHLSARYARALSGGESQRVCLARALVYLPDLLLLDEPFVALDTAARMAILSDLKQVAKDSGMTVIMISHNFQDALYFADRAIALIDGKIVQNAKPENMLRYPATKEVASIVGMDNIFPCRVEERGGDFLVKLSDTVSFYKKEFYNKDLRPTGAACCLPGDAVTILNSAQHESSETAVILNGVVTHIMPGIGLHQITVSSEGLSFTARIPRENAAGLNTGVNVRLAFDPSAAHVV